MKTATGQYTWPEIFFRTGPPVPRPPSGKEPMAQGFDAWNEASRAKILTWIKCRLAPAPRYKDAHDVIKKLRMETGFFLAEEELNEAMQRSGYAPKRSDWLDQRFKCRFVPGYRLLKGLQNDTGEDEKVLQPNA